MSADTEAIRAEARERVLTEALALGNALEHAVNQALEIDRLASLVKKLRQWVCCPRCGWMDGEPRSPAHQGCEDCEPLADLLTEMETG